MQAEGDVVLLPSRRKAPLDFATFFANEHGGLAFLKLWERWDRVDRIADPRAYLFRVALNGCRMRARTALRAARIMGSDPRPCERSPRKAEPCSGSQEVRA